MNYKKPWHVLNLDISNAVREDFDFENLYSKSEYNGKSAGIWNFMHNTVDQLLSQQWIDYMYSISLPVKSAIVFFREPYYIHQEAHVDMFWNGQVAIGAINWVLDPLDDSEMIWYDVPLDTGQSLRTPTVVNYLRWDLDSVENHVLDRRCIAKLPTLVNVGIPHNVIVRSRSRWAVSVRLDLQLVHSWQDTVDHFSPFIED